MADQAYPPSTDLRIASLAPCARPVPPAESRFVPGACSTSDHSSDPAASHTRSRSRTPAASFFVYPGRRRNTRGGQRIYFGKSGSRSGLNFHPGTFSLFGGGTSAARAVALWPLPFTKKRAAPASEKKRIMVLMSDTGGGHRASAEALKAGFDMLYGDKYQVDYVDVWSNWTPFPFNELPKTYSFLVKNPSIWRMGYYAQQPRLVHYPTSAFTSLFVSHKIGEAFDKYQPDLVVSVHPLMQHVPLRVLRQRIRQGLQKPVEFATVVTDLTTCHNTWFHPNVDRCFVPTGFARERALRMGLRPEQLTVHGLPIRPAFSAAQQPKSVLRKKLGMAPSTPAVLLVGGGEGMGAIERTVDAVVAKVGRLCQLVVICGRNKKLVEKLKQRQYPTGMHVVVNGFVDNMAEWMTASDTIVTKAGPGTIAESLICGLPVLLNGFVPCQEAGNVPFVIDHKVGAFERDPAKIAGILASWLGPEKAEFDAMAARAKAIGAQWQNALFRIVEDLAAMIKEERSPHATAEHARKHSWELGAAWQGSS